MGSVSALKLNDEPNEPEEEGGGGDEYSGGHACEDCGETEFWLQELGELTLVICTSCGKPQESAVWGRRDEG